MKNYSVIEQAWLDRLGIGDYTPDKELRVRQLTLDETNEMRKAAGLDPLTTEQLAANRGQLLGTRKASLFFLAELTKVNFSRILAFWLSVGGRKIVIHAKRKVKKNFNKKIEQAYHLLPFLCSIIAT